MGRNPPGAQRQVPRAGERYAPFIAQHRPAWRWAAHCTTSRRYKPAVDFVCSRGTFLIISPNGPADTAAADGPDARRRVVLGWPHKAPWQGLAFEAARAAAWSRCRGRRRRWAWGMSWACHLRGALAVCVPFDQDLRRTQRIAESFSHGFQWTRWRYALICGKEFSRFKMSRRLWRLTWTGDSPMPSCRSPEHEAANLSLTRCYR